MLFNRAKKPVRVASSFKCGVEYNPMQNEFQPAVGEKPSAVREYDSMRRDLREMLSPLPFPKGNMFSIEMRARIVTG